MKKETSSMRLPEKLSGAAAANSLLKPNFMRAAFFLSAMLRLFFAESSDLALH